MKDNKREIRNIDGEVIDFTKDDLIEKLTYESANLIRRIMSYVVDIMIVIVIWYLSTKHLFVEIDQFVESLGVNEKDYTNIELLINFREMIFQLYVKMILFWIFIKTLYFTLIPAIIGNGQTLGKLVAGIGVVDLKTLEEVSASRLVFREFIARSIFEGVLIIPAIISIFLAFYREDSRSLHDLMAKTVVIKLDLYDID